MKSPVARTLDETLSFESDAIESCRVPKTNINQENSPLVQIVTIRNDTGKESLKLTRIQTIQYHREFTLPKTVFKRPSTRKLAFLKNHLSASAIPWFEAPSDEMTIKNESYLEDVQSAHVRNLKIGQSNLLRLRLVSLDLLTKN